MRIDAVTDLTRPSLKALWESQWGGSTMISRGRVFNVDTLSALLARDEAGAITGAVTWHRSGPTAEIVSLNALVPRQGIGSGLLTAAESRLAKAGVSEVVIVTSNDNLSAVAFYQKRGYRLVEVLLGGVDRAREQKPSIPVIGDQGIPIHDEWVFHKRL